MYADKDEVAAAHARPAVEPDHWRVRRHWLFWHLRAVVYWLRSFAGARFDRVIQTKIGRVGFKSVRRFVAIASKLLAPLVRHYRPFLEVSSPGKRQLVAGTGVVAIHIVLVLLLVVAMQSQAPRALSEVAVPLGGPITTRADRPRLPKFMNPELPTVQPPLIKNLKTFAANVDEPRGSTNVTMPAQAIAEEHAFPLLPADFRNARTKEVRLSLLVTNEGIVSDASVVQSSGSDKLDSLAIDWVKANWRYRPALQNGVAIAVTTMAVVVFTAA